jgi:hypothetical protein
MQIECLELDYENITKYIYSFFNEIFYYLYPTKYTPFYLM